MTVTAARSAHAALEIRVRFEPGLGAALYAALRPGEVGPITVARALGRGRALLRFHGFTLMTQGGGEWKEGDRFVVAVKQLGPPLVLASVGEPTRKRSGTVMTVDTSVVPSPDDAPQPDARR
ncbi:MAG TPA: hypothetical protein VID50_08460 [Candidatus Eisenbacteria bacterium]|jgi:hypothetical protein